VLLAKVQEFTVQAPFEEAIKSPEEPRLSRIHRAGTRQQHSCVRIECAVERDERALDDEERCRASKGGVVVSEGAVFDVSRPRRSGVHAQRGSPAGIDRVVGEGDICKGACVHGEDDVVSQVVGEHGVDESKNSPFPSQSARSALLS